MTRTLFAPTTLRRALHRLGFVQADPIRAPARAQDLILFHRVKGYRAGDLERRYEELGVNEERFVNYGFVTSELQALMHPRPQVKVPAEGGGSWYASQQRLARRVLAFVRERGEVHPQEVEERFAIGTIRNWFGGASNATTHLLEAMLYHGVVRVVRRESGIRIYAEQRHGPGPRTEAERRERLDTLADAAIGLYAPLSFSRLRFLIGHLRHAVPQWKADLPGVIQRAVSRLRHACIDGVDWYWPEGGAAAGAPEDRVRLLSPFDPVVWDRSRFEILWGWTYRFEAYTPAAKRQRGYYALPLLWRDRVIGWGNVSVKGAELTWDVGFVGAKPRDRLFPLALEEELERLRSFLRLPAP